MSMAPHAGSSECRCNRPTRQDVWTSSGQPHMYIKPRLHFSEKTLVSATVLGEHHLCWLHKLHKLTPQQSLQQFRSCFSKAGPRTENRTSTSSTPTRRCPTSDYPTRDDPQSLLPVRDHHTDDYSQSDFTTGGGQQDLIQTVRSCVS